MTDDLTLSPLKLASEEDLIAELQSRCDACLIATLKRKGTSDYFFMDYKFLTACVGLAERAKARLIQKCLEDSDPVGEDEEF